MPQCLQPGKSDDMPTQMKNQFWAVWISAVLDVTRFDQCVKELRDCPVLLVLSVKGGQYLTPSLRHLKIIKINNWPCPLLTIFQSFWLSLIFSRFSQWQRSSWLWSWNICKIPKCPTETWAGNQSPEISCRLQTGLFCFCSFFLDWFPDKAYTGLCCWSNKNDHQVNRKFFWKFGF